MSTGMAIDLFRQALVTTFWVSMPLLAIGFVIGIVISLAQILTSIQDPSVGAAPRLAAFLIATLIAMPWMLSRLMSYTIALFGDLGRYAR
ncbi:MAG TPA: flagellar biosynthetic protein FliQ [Bryobacteraceae bacterium]|jgi:flagellar biosynthetic protein FliQ|nr:flagellar biosynthetic protein FliQ [Bryobacteraceae bacterium]